MIDRPGSIIIQIAYRCLVCLFLSCVVTGKANARVTLTASPGSGVAPLPVTFTCTTDATNPVRAFTMDFGDGSNETISTNKASVTFAPHTYATGGIFKPVCTVLQDLGTMSSTPMRVPVANWKFTTGGEVNSSPAFGPAGSIFGPNGTVFVGSDDGYLYAIDPVTGTNLDAFKTGDKILSSPVIDKNGVVYIGSLDGKLYALWYRLGEFIEKWLQPFGAGAAIIATPAIGSDGTIYFGDINGNFHALDPNGNEEWIFQAGDKIVSSPAIGSDGNEEIIYFGSLNHYVYAIRADNGSLKWKFPTSATVYASPAVGPDGRIYVGELELGHVESYNFKFYCINIDGTENWNVDTGTGVYSSPAIGPGGNIYVGSWDGMLYALSPTGGRLWDVKKSPVDVDSSPAVSKNEVVYVESMDSYFYAFQDPSVENESREDWNFKTEKDNLALPPYSSPLIGPDGTLYFGSLDQNIYAIPIGATLADSAWPMFHGGIEHRGINENIIISDIISTQPSGSSINVEISTSEILVNFGPAVEYGQIDIASFRIEQVNNLPSVAVDGYSVMAPISSDKRSAVFYVADNLSYASEYKASLNYTAADGTEKTYTWNFYTEAEPEKDPDPDPQPSFCFISILGAGN